MATTEAPISRALLDHTALSAIVVSALGLVGSAIGRLAGAKGFSSSDSDTSTLSNICFLAFLLGLLVAVVAGPAAWWTGRRTGRRGGVRIGLAAFGYLVVAIAVTAALSAN